MPRSNASLLKVIEGMHGLVVAAACDEQVARDVIIGVLRTFTDKLVDGRYFGFRQSCVAQTNPESPLVYDHAVPLKVIADYVIDCASGALARPITDWDGFEVEIREYLKVVELAKFEDDVLTQVRSETDLAGVVVQVSLKQRMPLTWSWGQPWDARYQSRGIALAAAVREADGFLERQRESAKLA